MVRSRFDLQRHDTHSSNKDKALDFESLEPRQMLAGDLTSSLTAQLDPDFMPLVHQVTDKVPAAEGMDYLRDYLDLEVNESFELINSHTDQIGFTHQRYQQMLNGMPVVGGMYLIHERDGVVSSVSGDYIDVDASASWATISESEAFKSALASINADTYIWEGTNFEGLEFHTHENEDHGDCGPGCTCPNCTGLTVHLGATHDHSHAHDISFQIPKGELVYVVAEASDEATTAVALAWKFDVYALEPLSRTDIFVDALNGNVIADYDLIHTADVPATGTSLYDGDVSFTADDVLDDGTEFRLRNVVPGVETYDMNEGMNYSAATDFISATSDFSDPDHATGVQAHWATEQTWEYFFNEHGRDSYNGNGATLISYVSYRQNYVNAFWNGSFMTYGDGNGNPYTPLVPLDIVGHEIAHGVTQFTANLIYQNESGALNESFSDIFGESVEYYARGSNDWLMSGDIGNHFRSMADPNVRNDPDTYQGDFWYTGSGDNGGVHINSGVMNFWFYLMVNGGTGTNDHGFDYDVTAVGMNTAQQIAYRNLSVYLTRFSTYQEARQGAVQAAIDLYGINSAEHQATADAWDAVGVYDPLLVMTPTALDPLGSLVYGGELTNQIEFAGDADTLELLLDENHTISLAIQPGTTLVPNISIIDPLGNEIANATGTGGAALVQTVTAVEAGTYSIRISGDSGTDGVYTMDLLLNAALEEEALDLGENNELAMAQDLDTGSLTLGHVPTSLNNKLSVVGDLAIGLSSLHEDDFESGSLGPEWTSSSTRPGGQVLVVDDSGSPDGTYALVMDTSENGTPNLNEAIYTVDLTDATSAILSFLHTSYGDENHSLFPTFFGSSVGDGVSISVDGFQWYTVMTDNTPAVGEWELVEINLIDAANAVNITLGADVQIKFQQYDNFSRAGGDGRGFDAIQILSAPEDWYAFTLEAGEAASVSATQVIGVGEDLQVDLFNSSGTLVAGGVAGPVVHSSVEKYINPGFAGTFYARVSGESDRYNLVVTRGAAFDLENGDPLDITDFDGALGYVVTVAQTTVDADDFDPGTVLDDAFEGVTLSNNVGGGSIYAVRAGYDAPTGDHVFGQTPLDDRGFREVDTELRADFDVLQSYVSIDFGSDDDGDAGVLRAYDIDDNLLVEASSSPIALGGSETVVIDWGIPEIAYIVAAGLGGQRTPVDNLVVRTPFVDSDTYEITATIGEQLDFQAWLPGKGPGLIDNLLDTPAGSDLRMELFDPNGDSVASGIKIISHEATISGTWQLVVSASEESGEYYIGREIVRPTRFDFGPESAPVMVDWLGVGTESYDVNEGYGWLGSRRNLAVYEFTRGNDLTGDGFRTVLSTFAIDVDDGTYDVDIHFGNVFTFDSVRINVEGDLYEFTPQVNEVRTFNTTVSDGQMTLLFNGNFGDDSLIRVAAIEIREVATFGGRSILPPESPQLDTGPNDGLAGRKWTIDAGKESRFVSPRLQSGNDGDSSLTWRASLPQLSAPIPGSGFESRPEFPYLQKMVRDSRDSGPTLSDADLKGQILKEVLDEFLPI